MVSDFIQSISIVIFELHFFNSSSLFFFFYVSLCILLSDIQSRFPSIEILLVAANSPNSDVSSLPPQFGTFFLSHFLPLKRVIQTTQRESVCELLRISLLYLCSQLDPVAQVSFVFLSFFFFSLLDRRVRPCSPQGWRNTLISLDRPS